MEIKFTDKDYKEFSFKLKEEEVQYFVEYAVFDLLKKGVLSLENPSEEEVQMTFLQNVNVESLPEA
jgi:hypothetical protein